MLTSNRHCVGWFDFREGITSKQFNSYRDNKGGGRLWRVA